MRKALLRLSLFLAAGLASGCGGGMGADTQNPTAYATVPSYSVDLACCENVNPETGECENLVAGRGIQIPVKVRNDSLDWFEQGQDVRVEKCSFELVPIGATPEAPPEAVSMLSCATPIIPEGQEGEVIVSIPDSFVALMKDEYFSSGLDYFTYQLRINLKLAGVESGEYELTVPVVLSLADYPIGASPEENACLSESENQAQGEAR